MRKESGGRHRSTLDVSDGCVSMAVAVAGTRQHRDKSKTAALVGTLCTERTYIHTTDTGALVPALFGTVSGCPHCAPTFYGLTAPYGTPTHSHGTFTGPKHGFNLGI